MILCDHIALHNVTPEEAEQAILDPDAVLVELQTDNNEERPQEEERNMIRKPDIPKFKSAAEEAEWWDQHREETAQWMEEAMATGQTTTLSDVLQRARQRTGSTPTVSIRIDPDDLTRARSLAAKKGLRYQTYLKMLLHEALERDERAS